MLQKNFKSFLQKRDYSLTVRSPLVACLLTTSVVLTQPLSLDAAPFDSFSRINNSSGLDITFNNGSAPALADIDGDGKLEYVSGNRTGGSSLGYVENDGGYLDIQTGANNPFNGITLADNGGGNLGYNRPIFADLDSDGDYDLIVGGATGTIHYLENDANTSFNYYDNASANNPFQSIDVGNSSSVAFSDIDNDGDLDALIAEHAGSVQYYRNDGDKFSPNFTSAGTLVGVSLNQYSSIAVGDIDNDNDDDLIACNNSTQVRYFENEGSLTFTERTAGQNPFDGVTAPGSYPHCTLADRDDDGDYDLIVGTVGSNTAYLDLASNKMLTLNSYSPLSPSDNATGVDGDGNLTIKFDQSVVANSGNIYIHQSSDDSVVDTIDVTSASQISISNTRVTFDPSIALSSYTDYYITIDKDAFVNNSDATRSYLGLSDPTKWNFTVGLMNSLPAITLPTLPSVNEDDSSVAIADDINISDVDGDNQTVTLGVIGGTVSVTNPNGSFSFISGDGSNDSNVSFSGSIIEIESALDSLTFTPTADLSGVNAATIKIKSEDANSGVSENSFSFDIIAVNDAPIVGTNTGVSIATNSTKTITNTMLNEGDVDDSGAGLTYTLTSIPSNGALWLDADTNSAQANDGSEDNLSVNSTFTQSDIDNNFLQYSSMSTLGNDSFSFSLADGGEDGASAASDTFNISILQPSLTYTNTLFESSSNDGSLSGSIVITLTGDTFVSDVITSNYVSLSNVPTGLTPSFNRDSDTQITVTFAGNIATGHSSSNTINNLSVLFTDNAYTDYTASTVSSSQKSDLNVTLVDETISGLVANRWNSVSVPQGSIVDTTSIGSSFITAGEDIKVYRNGSWVSNPTDVNPKEGVWVHTTGTYIPLVTTSNTSYDLADKAAQLEYYKSLESGKWHYVGVQHAMNYSDLTKANITPDNCNGYSFVKYYDPANDSWNTTTNIPVNSAIWLRHLCQ